MLSTAPGANTAIGPPDTTALLSVTVTSVKVTFPVFVTTNVYCTSSPKSAIPLPLTSTYIPSLVISIDGVWGIGVIVHSGHNGSTGHDTHGVGSSDSSVTGSSLGSVPVAKARLYT